MSPFEPVQKQILGVLAGAFRRAGAKGPGRAVLSALYRRLAAVRPDSVEARRAAHVLGLTPSHVGLDPCPESTRFGAHLTTEQNDAMRRMVGSSLTLLLGPPGGGKSETLAVTAGVLLSRGERVLVTAHTHVAVDNALARIRRTLPAWEAEGALQRIGGDHPSPEPSDRPTAGHRFDAALADLDLRAKRLRMRWRWIWTLRALISPTLTPASRAARIAERAESALRCDPGQADAQAVLTAAHGIGRATRDTEPQLVALTLSALAMRGADVGEFDTVIIDEGSTADLAQVCVASLHASERVMIFGDPRQLRPVCTLTDAETVAILGRNLYQHLGLDQPETQDPRRPTLRTQQRSAPRIRRIFSRISYRDMLRDGERALARGEGTVVLFNTEGAAEGATTDGGRSRVNATHARHAGALARVLTQRGIGNIAVITPYAAQAALLETAVEAECPGFGARGGRVGTVHRFQGDEADAVILDLVASAAAPGRFLDEEWNAAVEELLNVAASRARTFLYVIADAEALRRIGGVAEQFLRAVSDTPISAESAA